jgi:hypothetical protein
VKEFMVKTQHMPRFSFVVVFLDALYMEFQLPPPPELAHTFRFPGMYTYVGQPMVYISGSYH